MSPEDAVLDGFPMSIESAHRRRHASRKRLHEGQAGDNAAVVVGGNGLGAA